MLGNKCYEEEYKVKLVRWAHSLHSGGLGNFVEKATSNLKTQECVGISHVKGSGCLEHQNLIKSNSVALVISVPNCYCTDLCIHCNI